MCLQQKNDRYNFKFTRKKEHDKPNKDLLSKLHGMRVKALTQTNSHIKRYKRRAQKETKMFLCAL